jgi:hypothetical protein
MQWNLITGKGSELCCDISSATRRRGAHFAIHKALLAGRSAWPLRPPAKTAIDLSLLRNYVRDKNAPLFSGATGNEKSDTARNWKNNTQYDTKRIIVLADTSMRPQRALVRRDWCSTNKAGSKTGRNKVGEQRKDERDK